MNILMLAAYTIAAPTSLVGLLIWLAILAVVVWAIIALVKSFGIAIPQPVWIILTALFAIFLILLIARVFSAVL